MGPRSGDRVPQVAEDGRQGDQRQAGDRGVVGRVDPLEQGDAPRLQLVAAGILGIVNFAPVALSLPEGIGLVGVDLTTELEQLAFSVLRRSPLEQ